jgi:aminoglycoside N3'-acetyltransferase
MREFSVQDLPGTLNALGLRAGDDAIVHASLIGLGRVRGHIASVVPQAIVRCLLDYLGPSGTLAMPAFNFDFCKGVAFDRQRTPSVHMGQLAETLRTWPGSRRSRHPLQSISAVGSRAEEYCEDSGERPFADDSAFGRLLRRDAWVVLLGINFQAASFIHAAEERVGVPYRYWKEFRGRYVDNGREHDHRCWMYARDLHLDPQLDMARVEAELIERRQLARERLGGGAVTACRAQHLVTAAEAVLRRDPMALVGTVKHAIGPATELPAR